MPSSHRPSKTTAITPKAANRRVAQPPTPDLSGDEGYSALEDLDQSDDDDDNVWAAEEKHLITDLETGRKIRSPRPLFYVEENDVERDEDGDDEDEGADEEDNDDHDLTYQNDDDDLTYQDNDDLAYHDGEEGHASADEKSWNGISDGTDTEGDLNAFPAVERHVRFANVPESDSDSTETDDDHGDMFPDLFIPQTTLDPSLRREIERDPEESSGSGSYWDYQGGFEYSSGESDVDMFLPSTAVSTAPPSDDELTPLATPAPQMGGLSEVSSPTQALGLPVDFGDYDYESAGDTTEEDEPEPLAKKRSRRSEAGDDSDMEHLPVKPDRGKPRVGRFNLDKSERKPIAVLNPITRKMMIFTPHRHRQLDLSPEQFDFAFFSSVETTSPIGVNGAGYMLDSTMFSSNTFGDFMNGQELGDLPDLGGVGDLGDVDAMLQGALMSETNAYEDSFDSELGADEGEKSLDINDFITFGAGAVSESESDPERGEPEGSDAETLGHLTSATVGAFRQNQITQQLIFSNKATQDSLAFSGPFNDTAIRGLKSDRLATAGTPLTPVRRRRKSSVQESPGSPLEAMSQKRKAVGEHEGHKRQRSISDMALLHV